MCVIIDNLVRYYMLCLINAYFKGPGILQGLL